MNQQLRTVGYADLTMAEVNAAGAPTGEPLPVARVHVVRNIMVEAVEGYLGFYLRQHGIASKLTFGGYDDAVLEASALQKAGLDLIVCCFSLDHIVKDWELGTWSVDAAAERVTGIFDAVARDSSVPIVVNTFITPLYPVGGIVSLADPQSAGAKVRALNEKIYAYAAASNGQVYVLDWNTLAARLGEEQVLDRRMNYVASAPMKPKFLNQVAWELTKIIRTLKGKVYKCVVLDCDNTLWGGIVGEDGPDGIHLDPDSWPGRAYHDFQKALLALVERGAILALCSKNNDHDVWQIIDGHPHCLIRRDKIAAAQINWSPKAEGLAALAQELNIGLDSMVFVDDSAIECDQIRSFLPAVTVLQVPARLSDLPDLLPRAGLFEGLAATAEDRVRSSLYQAEKERKSHSAKFTDMASYLRSLGMRAHIHLATEQEVPRVAQLTQKTNQFNLTTRRYSEAEIRSLTKSAAARVYTLTVEDTFGSHGLTGVLIVRDEGEEVLIDSLLLSCRILGRGLEDCFVETCLVDMAGWGHATCFVAQYIATAKNAQTASFWEKFGAVRGESMGGSTTYAWPKPYTQARSPDYIEVVRG